MRKCILLVGIAIGIAAASSAQAQVSLSVIDSYVRPNAFGLAYDGSDIWWSDSNGSIHQMNTGGTDSGNVITGTTWSALAWDPNTSKIALVETNGITEYDRATLGIQAGATLNPVHTNIAGSPNFLTDGLDIQGSDLWWSPDVSFVAHSPLDGSGSSTTFLPSVGGYSGVEYLTVGANDYIFVVNDAFNPRQLCYHGLNGAQLGCASLPNSRYEDLAFDGRYLWAADFYGGRIDKIDMQVDGGSIFVPGGVPEPGTWATMLLGFFALGAFLRRRNRKVMSPLTA